MTSTFTKGLLAMAFCITSAMVFTPQQGVAAAAPVEDKVAGVKISAKFAYVGGYSSERRKGKTKGVEVYSIDKAGKWNLIQTVEALNPSYIAMDSKKRFLFSCQGDGDIVTAYAIDQQSGMLTKLNEKQTSGGNGVHLMLSRDDKFLVVANYAGGSVDSFALGADGSLGDKVSTASTQGEPGALKSQKGSYPHQVMFSPDDRFVLAPDKGRDLVHIFAFNKAAGTLTPNDPPALFSRPAVGSRHISFHPGLPFAYVMEESDNSITTCSWDAQKGVLTPLQWIPAIPDTYFPKEKGGNNHGSSGIMVAPSGKFVYVTNRGDNSVGIFAIDQKTGFLKAVGWEKTRGVLPRFFCFGPDGKTLFAANQRTGSIMAFAMNASTGNLTFLGPVVLGGSPTCILFR